MMRVSAALCVCALLVHCASSGRVLRRIKERVHRIRYEEAKRHLLLLPAVGKQSISTAKEGYVPQPLDHFDSQCIETIPQRFFVNEAFWKRPHGPVFLYIGGESAILETSVLLGHHVQMAEDNGALLVALEHRFYGKSISPNGLQIEKLRFLSSQQALADLVAFHRYIGERYSLTHKNTWISFGGSYPGALSAWFHGKFPHLVYGAVASSAPVKAKLDFSAYNKVVGESLNNEAVGGSEKCVNVVWEAFAAVEAALMGGNGTQAAKDFVCCGPLETFKDQIELVQSLADIIMGIVQYNKEWDFMSIAELCSIITNRSEVIEQEAEAYKRLVKLASIYRERQKQSCLQTSYKRVVEELKNTSIQTTGVGERQWYYQTCAEFGFYQTCEDANCPFSRMLTLQSQTELCPLVFGISESSLPSHIAFTNRYYGADHPQTRRVLYVNGDIDPWHELSVLPSGSKGVSNRSILINGTAHCADMNPHRDGDPTALKEAQKEIERHVALWLKTAAWELM
ncbi:thymus-specific serine protease [Scleropages formosus]|uniref:thymus-specific serine protease n=1 Tax=Scleropages formosus TaxID=113540 RepID=UPI0008783D54|nr:thymus-specific serine protease [Scleropages formosus]